MENCFPQIQQISLLLTIKPIFFHKWAWGSIILIQENLALIAKVKVFFGSTISFRVYAVFSQSCYYAKKTKKKTPLSAGLQLPVILEWLTEYVQ